MRRALIIESLSQGSRKSQGNARDFWEEEEQYRGACGLPFGKPLQRGCCFDERRREKNECRAALCRGEHSVVSQITEISFISFERNFVNPLYLLVIIDHVVQLFVAARKGSHTRQRHLDDAVRFDDLNDRVQLARLARDL